MVAVGMSPQEQEGRDTRRIPPSLALDPRSVVRETASTDAVLGWYTWSEGVCRVAYCAPVPRKIIVVGQSHKSRLHERTSSLHSSGSMPDTSHTSGHRPGITVRLQREGFV